MKTFNTIIQSYAKALKDKDYQAIVNLFSQDARVFSPLRGEQPPSIFFPNYFQNNDISKVEVKNIFFDVENKNMAAAFLYFKEILNKKVPIEFEVVDIFEFDEDNKIKTLKIVLDTHPIRAIREKALQ
jgi:hypothetical protein